MMVSALVVVYNRAIDDVACLSALLSEPRVAQIVVCDNGTKNFGNGARAAALGLTYLPMGGNVGLPRAYNRGVGACVGDVVCVLDDDSLILPGYFDALGRAWEEGGWDVLLPTVVTAGGRPLSPCSFGGLKARASRRPQDIPPGRLSGINSGMAVRRGVYEAVRYDERLFLDLVDHRFCMDARAAGMRVLHCPGMGLEQPYSLEGDDGERAATRYRIFRDDARAFYGDSLGRCVYCEAMLAWRRARLVARRVRSLMGPKGDAGERHA